MPAECLVSTQRVLKWVLSKHSTPAQWRDATAARDAPSDSCFLPYLTDGNVDVYVGNNGYSASARDAPWMNDVIGDARAHATPNELFFGKGNGEFVSAPASNATTLFLAPGTVDLKIGDANNGARCQTMKPVPGTRGA